MSTAIAQLWDRIRKNGTCQMATVVLFAALGCHDRSPTVSGQRPTSRSCEIIEKKPGTVLISEHSQVTHRFHVRNKERVSLTFGDVSTSCGCTRAQLDRRSLMPGETAVLEIHASTDGPTGYRRVGCMFSDNLGNNYLCELQYFAAQILEFDRPALPLGIVNPSSADTTVERLLWFTVRVPKNLGDQEPVLSSGDDGLTWKVVTTTSESERDLVVTKQQLQVSFSRDLLSTQSRATLSARLAADGVLACKEIPFNWKVTTNTIISPTRVFFTGVQGDPSQHTKAVSISRLDGEGIQIADVHCADSRVSVDRKQLADGEVVLSFSVCPAIIGTTRFFSTKCTVVLESPSETKVIPISGFFSSK